MNTYVEEYTSFMANVRHKSSNTVESYRRDVTQYITYLSESGIQDAAKATKTTILTYLMSLQKNGKANSTVSRTLAAT